MPRDRAAGAAGVLAGACFAAAVAGFGAALEGYGQLDWPVAVLGAAGVPRAAAFNLAGFIVPGLLAAFVAWRRRGALAPGSALSARLGWTLALLAALAFAGQGLLPLDPSAPDAGMGRLHGLAWAAWGLAFVAAAALLALAALRAAHPLAAAGHLAAGALVFALAWLAPDAVPAALAQRLAFACWLAWVALTGWLAGDGPGWSGHAALR